MKAKIAWLVWRDQDDKRPELHDYEPDWCYKKQQIVYFEVEE